MKSMKILEISLFFILLFIFLGPRPGLLALVIIYLFNLKKLMKSEEKRQNDRQLLELLASFSNKLQEGQSPIYAYEKMGSFEYPSFMLHPEDELFRWEIFEKQLDLYEKTVLMEEELEGEMMGVRLKMSIMKLMPLGLLFFLRTMLPRADYSTLNNLVVVFFLFNHWLAEKFMEKL